jgi:hypothetical protein
MAGERFAGIILPSQIPEREGNGFAQKPPALKMKKI